MKKRFTLVFRLFSSTIVRFNFTCSQRFVIAPVKTSRCSILLQFCNIFQGFVIVPISKEEGEGGVRSIIMLELIQLFLHSYLLSPHFGEATLLWKLSNYIFVYTNMENGEKVQIELIWKNNLHIISLILNPRGKLVPLQTRVLR